MATSKSDPNINSSANSKEYKANNPMSFSQYRVEATRDDIKKVKRLSKPYWWENIPIFGTEIYRFRMTWLIRRLDRGALRAEIYKLTTILLLGTFFAGFALAFTLTPWFYWAVMHWAILKVEKKLV